MSLTFAGRRPYGVGVFPTLPDESPVRVALMLSAQALLRPRWAGLVLVNVTFQKTVVEVETLTLVLDVLKSSGPAPDTVWAAWL